MSEQKNRHGCLTAFLIFIIIMNSLTALIYLIGSSFIKQTMPNVPSWAIIVMGIMCILNLVCFIALFMWKKWGFWGSCITAIIAFILNLSMGIGIGQSLLGLIGLAILYGVLHIGKENKGWTQLE
jgi:hypothetical protein